MGLWSLRGSGEGTEAKGSECSVEDAVRCECSEEEDDKERDVRDVRGPLKTQGKITAEHEASVEDNGEHNYWDDGNDDEV